MVDICASEIHGNRKILKLYENERHRENNMGPWKKKNVNVRDLRRLGAVTSVCHCF